MTSRPCVIFDGYTDRDGYGRVKHRGKTEQAHRVAFAESRGLSMGDIRGLIILHKCDVPGCVEFTHLVPGTHCDKAKRQRQVRLKGEAHPNSKLSTREVRVIKRLLSEGQKQKDIAAEYGVTRETVSAIKAGRSWAHV
jgi:hypothetical protein